MFSVGGRSKIRATLRWKLSKTALKTSLGVWQLHLIPKISCRPLSGQVGSCPCLLKQKTTSMGQTE